MTEEKDSYPASLSIDYPERADRLTSFFRVITIIPIFIVLIFLFGFQHDQDYSYGIGFLFIPTLCKESKKIQIILKLYLINFFN